MHLGPKKCIFKQEPCTFITGHKDSDVRDHFIMAIYTIPAFPSINFHIDVSNGAERERERGELREILFIISNLSSKGSIGET